jgi:hypothetical protein
MCLRHECALYGFQQPMELPAPRTLAELTGEQPT